MGSARIWFNLIGLYVTLLGGGFDFDSNLVRFQILFDFDSNSGLIKMGGGLGGAAADIPG